MEEKIAPKLVEYISDRDEKFETEEMHRLYNEYVKKYINRMKILDKDDRFKREDSVHGVIHHCHMMYKYKVNKQGDTVLFNSDKTLGYEFLVEFDKSDPEYGIYYGCRGLIMNGNQKEKTNQLLDEWTNILYPVVCSVLNNTFVNMDFSNRFQATNNVNNKTFWPFWIALGEDEDVEDIAVRAVNLICNVYRCYLEGKLDTTSMNRPKQKHLITLTNYTKESYRSILEKIENKKGKYVCLSFEKFIKNAVAQKIIEEEPCYELCWKFTKLSNVEVAHLITELTKRIGLSLKGNTVPWQLFIPIFLSVNNESFECIRQSCSISNNYSNPAIYIENARSILDNLQIIG